MSEFDDLLASVRSGESPVDQKVAEQSGENDYSGLLKQVRGQAIDQNKSQVESSNINASFGNPDDAAQRSNLASLLKRHAGEDWAPSAIDPEEAKRRLRVIENDHVLRNSPKLAEKYLDTGYAERTFDDTPKLSVVEQAATALKNTGSLVVGSMGTAIHNIDAGMWGYLLEMPADVISSRITKPLFGSNDPFESVANYAERMRKGSEASAGITREFAGTGKDASYAARMVGGALESVTQSIVTLPVGLEQQMTKGTVAAGGFFKQLMDQAGNIEIKQLLPMGAITAGQSYGQAKDQGVDPLTAALYSTAQGAVEIGTERIGLGQLVRDVKMTAPIWKLMRNQLITENVTEQVATHVQDLNDWAVLPENANKTFGDYLEERPSAALDTLVQTSIATLVQTGLMRGSVNSMRRKMSDADKAIEAEQNINEVIKSVSDTRSHIRNADDVASLIQDVGINDVYIDANAVAGILSQGQLSQLATEQEIQQAINTGGDLVVPASKLAIAVAQDPSMQGVVEHVRIDPNLPSASEARAVTEQSAMFEKTKEEADKIIATKERDDAFIQSAREVETKMFDQIKATGQYPDQVAKTHAQFIRDWYVTQAAAHNVTPSQFYEMYPYKIAGGEEQAQQETLNQDILNTVNPTGSVFSEYSPQQRLSATLGKNITTLADTAGKNPDEIITIYRGVPSGNKEINAGDFVTTNKQLAKDYAGTGNVIEKQVRYGDILDQIDEPLGEEYIYRPAKYNEFIRNPALSQPERQVEQSAYDMIAKDETKMIDDYFAKNGNMIDPDKVKAMFPAFVEDPMLANAVHEPSSYLAKKIFTEALKRNAGKPVLFTAGGGGSGKTESTTMSRKVLGVGNDLVYDSTFSSFNSAKSRIDEALASGSKVAIVYTNRNVIDAFELSLLRDRVVNISALAKAHVGASNAIRQLTNYYQDNPNVSINVVNNLGNVEDMHFGSIDDVYDYDYNSVERSLYEKANQARAEGWISEERLAATVRGATQVGAGELQEGQQGQDLGGPGEGKLNQPKKSDIGHKREGKSGRYVGAPDWIGTSPQQLAVLRNKLRKLAIEGESGRFWYEKSSKAVLDLVGGDKADAEKFVGLLAIYSQGTEVNINLGFALEAYYQWKAGVPIDTGRFPAAQGKKAVNWLEGKNWGGIKTNNFYADLMEEIDPSKVDEGHATMDMWMALAFDYGMKVLDQGPKYNFAKREVTHLADELGWKPHQVQAAIWTAIKARVESSEKLRNETELKLGIGEKSGNAHAIVKGKEYEHFRLAHKLGMESNITKEEIAAKGMDFADALNQRMVQLSWEATPSITEGSIPGIHSAPFDQKLEYLEEVSKALTENGENLISKAVGLKSPPTMFGVSAWEGATGAGAQSYFPVPITGQKKDRAVVGVARDTLNLYSALKGLVLRQDAVVWHTPIFDEAASRKNGAELITNRALTEDEIKQLYQAIYDEFGTWELAPGYTANGARILNFVNGLDNKNYQKRINKVFESLPEDFGGGNITHADFRSDGDYISNDWKENKNGESYENILRTRSPDFLIRATELRSRVEAVNDKFIKKYGWDKEGTLNQLGTGRASGVESLRASDLTVTKEYGTERSGSTSVIGVHYSGQSRAILGGNFYGTGLEGAEKARLENSSDTRLRNRIHFYVDTGNGIRPEVGVGENVHAVKLNNLYDVSADPLKLRAVAQAMGMDDKGTWFNAVESAILNAGFDGVYIPHAQGTQGVAVLLGDHRNVQVDQQGQHKMAPSGAYQAPATGQRKLGLMSSEIKKFEAESEAIKAAAPSAELKASNLIFNESDLDAISKFFPAASNAQVLRQESRGQFDPSNLTTILGKESDYSTFLHESAHFFMTVYADMATSENATPRMKQDMQTLLDWFGVKDLATWNSMTLNQQRKYHEQFAYNYEIYLFEGKAPSVEMQTMFDKFSAWLRRVYKSIRDELNDLYRKENGVDLPMLTGEVRDVMDRMLASEEQIKQAEQVRNMVPMYQSQEQSGMDAGEWAAYQEMIKEARDASVTDLTKASLRQMQWLSNAKNKIIKNMQKEHDFIRKQTRDMVAEQVSQEPVYKAINILKNPESGVKLSTQEVQAMMFGEDISKLGTGKTGMMKSDGMSPDMAAEVIGGYDSGEALVFAIMNATPFNEEVDARTDKIMLAEHGELSDPKSIEVAVDRALHNEARARFVAVEMRHLAKATQPVRVMLQAAKMAAKSIISGKVISDIRPHDYSIAEARASRQTVDHIKKGESDQAIISKRNQLLNNQLATEALAARQEIEKGREYLKKIQSDKSRQRVGADHMDQIDQILERFELRKITQKEMRERISLSRWIEQQREMGYEPEISPEMEREANAKPYTKMTMAEFRDLVDTVKQIEHLGRTQQNMLTAAKDISYKAARDQIVESINANAKGRVADTRTPTTELGRYAKGLKRFWASHIKAATVARVLDGGKDGGPMWEYFIRTANERGDMETGMRAKATEDLTKIMAPIFKEGHMGGKGKFFPTLGRSLNKESRIAIALNMGNEGNIQRLLGGEGWTIDQVIPVLESITESELHAVQQIWDYFESFRPQIAEKERRLYGKEPKWIDPSPISIKSSDGKTVKLAGGYYPIKYDISASQRAESHADAEEASRMLKGAYTSATTRRSFTKERVAEVKGRPLVYTMAGMYSGINDVIHDLAWHEWLIDANKLIRSQSIDEAIRNQYGPEFKSQLKTWINDVAIGEGLSTREGEIALGKLRQGISAAGLGFNVMSAMQQITGFNQSIVRVGAGYIGRGISKVLASPIIASKEANDKSSFMANRAKTQFRELNELRNKIQGQSSAMRTVQLGAYYMMMRMQRMVDLPTWHGAYEKAIGEGNDEARSIALADQAVIDSQGSGMVKDLSAIERGGPALKLFTVYYSYMNTVFNMGTTQAMTAKSKGKLAADMVMLFTVPVVLTMALKAALTPGGGDDDWDLEELARKLAAEQLSYLMGAMVILREFSEASKIVTGAEGAGRDYSGPAGVRLIADAMKFTKQAEQGEFDDAFRKASVNLLGDATGLPSAQINRTINGLEALSEGETENPAAVLFGYQK